MGWATTINGAGDRIAIGAPYNDGSGSQALRAQLAEVVEGNAGAEETDLQC